MNKLLNRLLAFFRTAVKVKVIDEGGAEKKNTHDKPIINDEKDQLDDNKTPPVPLLPPTDLALTWKGQRADDFFQHNRDGENEYRTNALNAAKVAGLDCIRCRASFGMSDELGMHLVKLEHPDRPGYFLERDGWFFQAKGWGVTRWQHDLGTPSPEQAKRWAWLTKAYTKDELQFIVARTTAQSVADLLKANATGVAVVVE